MSEWRTHLRSAAGTIFAGGLAVLLFKAANRGDVGWWTDPVFWVGVCGLAAGASLLVWPIVSSYTRERRSRRDRDEELELQGRANQRQGLDELANELGQISSQLKGELRWGKRNWNLLPNTAWAKNQHLVTEEGVPTVLESAYAQAYELSQETQAATEEELGSEEMEKRQGAKESVDAAAGLIDELRDEIQL